LNGVAVANLEAGTIEATGSAVALVRAESVKLDNCQTLAIYSESVDLDNSQAVLVVAQNLNATTVRTGVLLAGQVQGDVQTVIDTPRALLAGITIGTVTGLVLYIIQSLLRRRS
jgi:hypothetical protein